MSREGKIFTYFCHNFYYITNTAAQIGQTDLITCRKLLDFFLQCKCFEEQNFMD